MLVSIVERFQEKGEREVDRHAAWAASIERLQQDFENGKAPGIPQLREYLIDVPDEQRCESLQDLVGEHLRLAWQEGPGPKLEEYLAEFSSEFGALAAPSTLPADTVEDEFLARYQSPHGDAPPVAEYDRRFPNRPDISKALQERFFDGDRLVNLHLCGRGAMGEVWEVYETVSRESIALKTPGPGPRGMEEALRQLSREVSITGGLDHPGIVHLTERSRTGDERALYTMRFARGEPLDRAIESYHHPPSDRTPREQSILRERLLRSTASACDVIASAHSGGVVHRDLKPGNVILETSGEVAILDWGMATRLAPATVAEDPADRASPAVIAGTPEYMSPEQADGVSDPRSDVFGLGAILYEILTGRPPQPCSHLTRPAEWGPIVRKAAIEAPRRLVSRIPRPLEAVCLKALARQRDDRYQDVAALAADLRAYLAGEPVSARPKPSLLRPWQWWGGRR